MDERIHIKNKHFLPTPSTLDFDSIPSRGFSVYGMSKRDFMFNNLTLGLEYARNGLERIFKMYEGIGRFGNRATTPSDFYQAMINTSMICWMNSDTGHIEFSNIESVYKNTDTIRIIQCRIELNHEVMQLGADYPFDRL